MNKVNKIYNQIKRKGLLEDRSEYDVEDLQKAYKLNKKEAKSLYLKIQLWRRNHK